MDGLTPSLKIQVLIASAAICIGRVCHIALSYSKLSVQKALLEKVIFEWYPD